MVIMLGIIFILIFSGFTPLFSFHFTSYCLGSVGRNCGLFQWLRNHKRQGNSPVLGKSLQFDFPYQIRPKWKTQRNRVEADASRYEWKICRMPKKYGKAWNWQDVTCELQVNALLSLSWIWSPSNFCEGYGEDMYEEIAPHRANLQHRNYTEKGRRSAFAIPTGCGGTREEHADRWWEKNCREPDHYWEGEGASHGPLQEAVWTNY